MPSKVEAHIGIDYGSKMAGTTVIASADEHGQIVFTQSQKKQDADKMIETWLSQHPIKMVFIDAPLSLPLVYKTGAPEGNYFYRKADQELRAMSPMFLGGLTARAMRLKAQLGQQNCQLFEVYPGQLAKHLGLSPDLYKKDKSNIADLTEDLINNFSLSLVKIPENWHQFDALLAYISGLRFSKQEHLAFGESSEGLIII